MTKAMAFLAHGARLVAAIAGAALVMAAWSEFYFFNEGLAQRLILSFDRGLATGLGYVGEIGLFYLIPAAFLVGVLSLSGSIGPARILLIGALTGFVIEGAVVPAVYEAVPFSFLWTAIAWHGPVTVALGVFVLPRLVASVGLFRIALVAVGLGVAWGVWMPWTWMSDEMVPISGADFLDYAIATTAIMLAGYSLMQVAHWPEIRLPRWLSFVLILPSLALFAIQGTVFPAAALGVAVILLVLALMLWVLGAAHEKALQPGWSAWLPLALMPAAAIFAYAAMVDAGSLLPVEDLPGLAFLGGMILWITGVARGMRRRGLSAD